MGRKVDRNRIDNVTPEALKGWFDSLQNIIHKLKIQASDMYNMDETGINLGACNNTTVIGSTQSKSTFKKTPENREWASIIETVSVTGAKLPPVIIFKGKGIQSSWYTEEGIPNFLYTTSMNGWTSNDIGLHWLHQAEIPATSPPTGQWRLLILDGYGSHAIIDFMWDYWINNIYLFYLIPHSSHILQPLNLSCFSPLKSRYRSQIEELARIDDAALAKKRCFLLYYKKARNEGLTCSNICSGWNKAGILPWNSRRMIQSIKYP